MTAVPFKPPPALFGGSRLRCPVHLDQDFDGPMCGWSRKNVRGALRRYRRHWYRAHARPFLAAPADTVLLYETRRSALHDLEHR